MYSDCVLSSTRELGIVIEESRILEKVPVK